MESNDSKKDSSLGNEGPPPIALPAPKKPEATDPMPTTLPERQVEVTPDPERTRGDNELERKMQPVRPQIEGNRPLSEFEKKTVLLGWLGFAIGGLSLLAACVAAVFVYHQWAEMNQQTGLMNLTAKQARKDSADASLTTSKQISILQGQLREQQNSVAAVAKQMRQDQRPWLRVEFAPTPGVGNDPTKPQAIMPLTVGQPMSIPIRIRNTGKTPAEIVTAYAVVELAGDKDPMGFPPEKNLAKRFPPPKRAASKPTSQAKTVVNQIETGVIFPDSFTERGVTRGKTENGKEIPDPLLLSEVTDIVSGRAMIYVAVRIEYFDEFGKRHWTDFCRPLSDASENRLCAKYNAVDDN